jgi:tetratricopeptide (TPR) repeat protein
LPAPATAAVIGTEVSVPLLQRLVGLPEDVLQRSLVHLQGKEFLHETQFFPDQVYTFKHALTQQVAYGSLVRDQRRVLHARTVEALEALAGDRLAEQIERLAYHALRGEVWGKAVTYCRQAGARAHDRAAFHEAAAAFEQAVQALVHLPEHPETGGLALELRLAWGRALYLLGEYGRYLALLGEAEALARALDDRRRLGWVLAQMARVRRQTGDLDGAMAAGQQTLALAAALGDRALQAEAAFYLGQVCWSLGDFGRAAALLRQNVEGADGEPGTLSTSRFISSRAWLARTLSALGAFAEGRRHGEEALRLAMREGRGNIPMVAHGYLGELHLAQGDLERAIRMYDQGLTLCRASDDRNDLRGIAAGLGFALALQGRLGEGRALLEEGISGSIRTGGVGNHSRYTAWLSAVDLYAGGVKEAWQHACQALDRARQQKARGHQALALFQLGAVHAQASPPTSSRPKRTTRRR